MASSWSDRIPGKQQALNAWSWMGQSTAGESFRRGLAESFGFPTGKNISGAAVNEGFLGWRSVARENYADIIEEGVKKGTLPDNAGVQKRIDNLRKNAGPARAKWLGRGGLAKTGGRLAMKSFPLLFTGYFAYQGYKENGVLGAAGGIAESVLYSSAMHYLGAGLSNPLTWAVAGGVALGVGGYVAGEKAQAYRRGLRQVEMGSNVVDPFQTAATLRQRSLMALQNSKINGRMGIGNEALIMHRSF